jgi:F0F1-type ATP synthase membrane subunit b/b'
LEFAGFKQEVNQRFDKIENRIDKIERRIDEIDRRLGKVEINQEGMNDKLEEAFEAITALAESNERQHQEIMKELRGEISVVELAVKRMVK